MMTSTSHYTIHCFGASLTEGLTWEGIRQKFTPYSDFLPEYLNEEISRFMKIDDDDFPTFKIHNYGVSGEETGEIRERFNAYKQRKVILNDESEKEIFIFLAGTNDLGMGKPVDVPFSNMYAMIFDCINSGSKVVVCSLPSTQVVMKGSKDILGKARDEYNHRLESLCQELGEERAQFFDLFTASGVKVYEDDGKTSFIQLKPEYAADNIHLTTSGYKMLGQGVAKCIARFFAPAVDVASKI